AYANGNHNVISARIFSAFDAYFITKNIAALAFPDVDVYLPDGNIFRPDLCIVSDLTLIGKDGKVHGVPDLCVEILSPSTMKNDLGIKKVLYEKYGVKEYWIIDQLSCNIYTHMLDGDHYRLNEACHLYDQIEREALNDKERSEIKDKIQVGIYPELSIDLKYIFRSLFN
ncbi:MAG: Uma2 family endonuclease, partial [Selenomonadaceae bacterium]|nr:Uma2 family endonuclease [Selenomonadaceae bacterium]